MGASALSYRIEVAGRPYLLRLESFRRDEVRDPHRCYVCMQAAVEAGIAPAVHHADAAAGVVITDFVPNARSPNIPEGRKAWCAISAVLSRGCRQIPAFPPVSDYLSVIG